MMHSIPFKPNGHVSFIAQSLSLHRPNVFSDLGSNALSALTPSGRPSSLHGEEWAVPSLDWVNRSPSEGQLPILPSRGNQRPPVAHPPSLPSTYIDALNFCKYSEPQGVSNNQPTSDLSDQIFKQLLGTFWNWSPNGKFGETGGASNPNGCGNSGFPSSQWAWETNGVDPTGREHSGYSSVPMGRVNSGVSLSLDTNLPLPQPYDTRSLDPLPPPLVCFPPIHLYLV